MERKLKDSGIHWIGQIPKHWNVSKIGQLYDNRYERVSDKDFEPLSVTMQGVLPQLETAAKTDDGDNRKLVRKGDFAINSRSDRRGSCGISPQDGSVSLINLILAPRTTMNADYYNWLFHTTLFADEFYSWGHGIVADLWTTRWQEMKNIAIPTPPLAEQEAIAVYLDKKCGEIDELIEVEQQMISDLESYRQSVITEAVTHGLNPDVEMREPGIDWVANFPAHWNIIRFKSIFSTRKGLNITKADLTESGVPVISYGQIHSKQNCGTKVVHDIIKYVPETFLQSDRNALVKQGNFIFADTSEDIAGCGNCAYIDYEGQIFAGYHSIIASRSIKENNKYFAYLFLTDCWRSQIRRKVTGIKVFSVNQAMLSDTLLIVPPLSEQQEIADYLDAKCAEIDELIKVKQEKIETLKQYRQSLIFEAVTGKTTIA
ncbi:MAG: restriction endonuclease subunit S [Lepagella sp.]